MGITFKLEETNNDCKWISQTLWTDDGEQMDVTWFGYFQHDNDDMTIGIGKTHQVYSLNALSRIPDFHRILQKDYPNHRFEKPKTTIPQYYRETSYLTLPNNSVRMIYILSTRDEAEKVVSDYSGLFFYAGEVSTNLLECLLLIGIQSVNSDLHDLIYQWAGSSEHVRIKSLDDFEQLFPAIHHGTPTQQLTAKLLGMFSLVETIDKYTNITEVIRNRAVAAYSAAGKPPPEVEHIINTNQLIAAINALNKHKDLIRMYLDFMDANTTTGIPIFRALSAQVLLAGEFFGMSLIQTTLKYCSQAWAALILDKVSKEKADFIRIYHDLEQRHGKKFKYLQLEGLYGLEQLDKSHFPNLMYCAWYERKTRDPSFALIDAPEPTMEVETLEVASALPLSCSQSDSSCLSEFHSYIRS